MKTNLKVFTLIVLIFTSTLIYAQQKNGQVEGTVKDVATGEVLPFASVSFLGTTNGTITNDKGFYSIGNIKPGSYKIKVTYVSYTDTTVEVHVGAGQVLVKNIALSFETTMTEEVTITAQAYGQIKAINTQISARTIKNVVSEQKIRELPDANAAEALARLPGVSVERSGGEATSIKIRGVGSNTVYVNGMRMTGGLGSVSSSMIGSIELSKAFMPDQDADILGGSVDFKMREAPSGFKKEIWFRQGYNDFTKSFKNLESSLLLSNRFFKDKLGVMLSFNYDRKDRGRDILQVGYNSIGSSKDSEVVLPVKINGVTLTRSQNLNNRYGLTVFTDYKLKNGRVFYQGFFSSFDADNKSSANSYIMRYTSNISTNRSNNIMNGIGGEHTILGAKIDWGVSLSTAKSETPVGYSIQAISDKASPDIAFVDSSTTIDDYLAFGIQNVEETWANSLSKNTGSKSYTDELAYRLNIEVPFKLGKKISGYVKLGGKARDIDRGNDYNILYGSFQSTGYYKLGNEAPKVLPDYGWTYTSTGELGVAAFLGPNSTQDYSLLNTKLYNTPDYDKVIFVEKALENKLGQILNLDKDNYTNHEQFYAGYLMTGIDIGKIITFTPGVRYEKNTYSTTAKWIEESINYGPLTTQGEIRDTTDGFHNTHFFPMVHLRIKPLKWFDIRMAYTNTVSRPGFGSMSPRSYRDPKYNLTKGNVFLKPQSNYNYDVYLSFYTGKLGLFTAGAFYKEMTDQVLNYTVQIINPANYNLSEGYKNKNLTVPVNNKWPGYIKGIELDWQTQFAYLPKPFNGIILNANITYMQSRTRYPFFSFERVLIPDPPYVINVGKDDSRVNKIIGMPDMVGNIALGYETGGFSGRISSYYQSATITNAQATNKSVDQDKASLLRFDLQLSQKIKKIEGLTFYLNVNNLTNNADRTVLTYHPDRLVSDQRYGMSADMGVRYKF